MGLPGSGKSTLGKELESQGYLFIDDVSLCGLGSFWYAIEQDVNKIAIADVFLCRKKDIKKCRSLFSILTKCGYELEWVFFENNVEKCLKNVEKRNDGRIVEGLVRQLSKEYVIPENITERIIKCDENAS